MESLELSRRKALQASVAALCVEVGFVAANKDCMGTLSEILQSYITELGRTSRLYSELAQRTEPTASDVQLALVDAGTDISSLPSYAKRPQRRHLHRQSKNYLQPQPKCLQVGTKAQRPPNVPPHLPAFPDPHTYIKTPVFANPSSDYKVVREKLAAQKRSSRKSLSSLISKTRPSCPVSGESDPFGMYTVVKSEAPDSPVYLLALAPTADDLVDTLADNLPQKETESKENVTEQMDTSLSDADRTMDCSMDTFQNPFLKKPKREKLPI